MLDNPIVPSDDSAPGGESQNSTPDTDLSTQADTTEDTGSDSSPNPSDVDVEAIKQEKRAAVTEAKKRFHESETARAEASTLRSTLASAVKTNPDLLLELRKENPQLADNLSKELFDGNSVDDLLEIAARQQQTPQQPNSYDDIRKVIREESAAEQRKTERKNIERLEIDFFVENDIDPKSETYKQIMGTYQRLKPKSFDEAKEVFELAHARSQIRPKKPVGDINQVYTPSFGSAPTVAKKSNKGLSENQKSIGKMLGLTDKYL